MMVAIMFLIIDFWYAQNNPSVSTTIVENNTLQLPVIFACLSVPNIPTFENLSREQFAGEPLWGLSTYSNDQKNQFLKYPKTKDVLTTPSLLGNEAVCSSSLQHLSLRGTLLGLTPWGNASRRCFSCLKIGVKQPIVLSASPEKHRPAGPIKLGFSFSRYLSFCFNGLADGFNIILMNNLRETIKRSSQQLLEKRIVQMVSNKNGSRDLEVAFDIGFNPYVKKRKSRVLRQRLEAELLCNLYFFSGHFFPIEPGTAVQYSFDINRELNAWQPVGDLSNVFRIPTSYMEVYNRTTILEGIRNDNYGNRIVFSLPGIYIYSMGDNSDGQPSFRNKLDWIVGRETCLIRFTKHIENEVVTYGYSIQRTGIGTSITNDMFSRVQLSLDFETFSTEVVTKRPTTSFVEFCTDLFEYAGLFTGVCVYSMFVGPARMYLKRFKKQSD